MYITNVTYNSCQYSWYKVTYRITRNSLQLSILLHCAIFNTMLVRIINPTVVFEKMTVNKECSQLASLYSTYVHAVVSNISLDRYNIKTKNNLRFRKYNRGIDSKTQKKTITNF